MLRPPSRRRVAVRNPMFLMLGLFLLFWIVVILPMSRRSRKEQEKLLASISRGSKILTSSHRRHRGHHQGRRDEIVIRSEDTKLRIKRSTVSQVLGTDTTEAAQSNDWRAAGLPRPSSEDGQHGRINPAARWNSLMPQISSRLVDLPDSVPGGRRVRRADDKSSSASTSPAAPFSSTRSTSNAPSNSTDARKSSDDPAAKQQQASAQAEGLSSDDMMKAGVADQARIDPADLKNVTVRPLGNTRVEIIMPTGGSAQGNRAT